MTKNEKKVLISQLIEQVLAASDVDDVISIREKMIREIYSSGFDEHLLPIVSKMVDLFGKDIDEYIKAKFENKRPDKSIDSLKLSIAALINVIGISQLPE